jgi:type II secretory pathway pseudopilin PulG
MMGNEKGMTIIDLLFVCGMIGILSIIATPRLILARQSANASSAIASMRAIDSAQLTFALTCGGGFYSPDLTTLGVAPPGSNQAFLSPDLTAANTVTKSGYIVTLSATAFVGAPASCNGLGPDLGSQAFVATADPTEPTNVRFFATNVNSSIWEHTATLAGQLPEVGNSPVGHIIR